MIRLFAASRMWFHQCTLCFIVKIYIYIYIYKIPTIEFHLISSTSYSQNIIKSPSFINFSMFFILEIPWNPHVPYFKSMFRRFQGLPLLQFSPKSSVRHLARAAETCEGGFEVLEIHRGKLLFWVPATGRDWNWVDIYVHIYKYIYIYTYVY